MGIEPKELEFEDREEEEAIKVERKNVIAVPSDPNISVLYNKFLKGDLILEPEFQRLYVWDNKKASRLVESVLLNIPIPVIYVAEDEQRRWIMIDGQQRLVSLFRLFGPLKIRDQKIDELKLRGLTVHQELNGKIFRDMPRLLQRQYENYPIRTVVIKKESDQDVKFEIFERLNTGSVTLNHQELRNCVYRGKYNNLIRNLASDRDFLFLLGLEKPHYRMQDRELTLRFFAFYHKTYLHYAPPVKQFLNREMEGHQDLIKDEERKLREVFRKCVKLSKTIFGEHAFRRFIFGSEKDPNGKWEKRVNRALFDVVMFGFSRYEKRQVVPHADAIREELLWLMTHSDDFIDTILFHTDKREKVEQRFKIWLGSLEKIAGLPTKEPRAFSLNYKEQLWKNDPTCAICNQRIHLLDDAEIDHIEFYWRGGETIPSNARLVHRYCNRARGGR